MMSESKPLKKFINIHKGGKCFVFGAGTSLADMDLSDVYQYPIVCINSACLLMPWGEAGDPLRRFWVSTDILCSEWNYFKTHVVKADCTRIVRNTWERYPEKLRGGIFEFFNPRKMQSLIARSPSDLLGGSSILSALDLAILLGCKQIYLLGADHVMAGKNSHFWQYWPKEKWPRRKGKLDNFRPNIQQQERVFKSNMYSYKIVKKYAETMGAKIYNCSPISIIEVFKKCSLEDALK